MASLGKKFKRLLRLLLCLPKAEREPTEETLTTEKRAENGQSTAKTPEQELAEQKANSEKLNAEKLRLEDEIRKVKELVEALKKEVGQKDANIQQFEKDRTTMQAKLAKLSSAEARAQDLTTRLAEKEKLLSERTTELNAAQVFLTKVDAVSEAEVVGMVDNLNTLICSASGALSDAWDQREHIPGMFVEESDMKQIREYFGDLIVDRILVRDAVAVNLAIQTYLSRFIERITSGWGTGETAGNLANIYGMISSKENQTVASRWRTLTKRYTPHQEPPQSEEIFDGLARILMATHTFPELSEAMESVTSGAGTEIKAIIEATVQLDDTIKTKIASSDMFVCVVLRGEVFAGESMVDEFNEDGSGDGGEGATVAGTMEVGLLQRTNNTEKVLRKPKVILERDLVEPEGGNR